MARRGRRLSDTLKNRSCSLLRLLLSRSCFRHLAASSLVKILCVNRLSHAIAGPQPVSMLGVSLLLNTLRSFAFFAVKPAAKTAHSLIAKHEDRFRTC